MIEHENFGGEKTYTTGLVFSDTMSQESRGGRNSGEAVQGNLIN